MRNITEIKTFPIYAGMPLDGKGINKIRKVGTRTVVFIYLLHSDGDKQLVGERTIKTVITA